MSNASSHVCYFLKVCGQFSQVLPRTRSHVYSAESKSDTSTLEHVEAPPRRIIVEERAAACYRRGDSWGGVALARHGIVHDAMCTMLSVVRG